MALLEVDGLRVHFHTRDGVVRAVDSVSLAVDRGETLGIVGESGSGKSVAMYTLMGLVPMPPGRLEGGAARFDGMDLFSNGGAAIRALRGRRIGMIFQDPMTALNPYMRIGAQIMEPLRVHEGCSKTEARQRAVQALDEVGIPGAAGRLDAYPHQFSGGMRQRVTIAMALITNPDLLIADEPTTALDVTVQAQILELIQQAKSKRNMAAILITHDMGVVAGTCERVAVMYAGRVMESAPTALLFEKPRHPYTQALLDALPAAHRKGGPLYTIPGLPPDGTANLPGCPFAPRCPHATPACTAESMALETVAPGHASACIRVQRGEL